jgi:hypothetical protein
MAQIDKLNTSMASDLSIDKFTSNFVDGTRQNRFLVDFSPLISKFEGIIDAQELNRMKFLVSSTNIPGRTIGTVNANFQGTTTPYAGNTENQTWSTTFLSDIGMVAEKFIDAWMLLIHQNNTNIKGYASEYKIGTAIKIYQLDPKGVVIEESLLKNIFPSSKAERSSDTSSAEFQSYQVTWHYDYWIRGYAN